jgi:HAD superfamily hydrolase (TIGR01509 family)
MDTIIKLVVLDLNGVLLTDEGHGSIQTLSSIYGLDQNALKELLFERAPIEGGYNNLKLGKIPPGEYWSWLLKNLDLEGKVTRNEIIQALNSQRKVDKVIEKAIWRLKERGIMTATCSNNYKENIDYYENKFGINKYFDEMVFSYVVGKMKPDSAIFYELLERCKLSPKEALYFDDNQENVEAALNIGIESYLYMGTNSFTKTVMKHGIDL